MKTLKITPFIRFIFLVLFAFLTLPLWAQLKDTRGKEFWLMFPKNYTQTTITLSLFISSKVPTTGTVTIEGISFTQSFTTTPGTITTITIPASAQHFTSDAKENKGIHITAAEEVSVYGLNRETSTTDAYVGIPVDAIGNNYLVMSWKGINNGQRSQLGIVATQNNTSVTITQPGGSPNTISLNEGETYAVYSINDLSGTYIQANKPVSVFGGNECTNVPIGYVYCDHLVEQLPDITSWGKRFITVPLKTRLNGDTWRILAAEDGTIVKINGTTVATLAKGEYYTRQIVDASEITSTKPVLVAQFSNSSSWDGVTSDPFMMIVPPAEQFLTSYTVSTPASGFSGNYLNIAAPTAAVGSIRLDGSPIPAGSFNAIGSTGFSFAQVNVGLGVHNLDGSSLPFGVFSYGFDQYDSYGYAAGATFSPVSLVNTISLSPASGTGNNCTEKCWTATVKDGSNNPLNNVRVDFTITGANPAQSGVAYTDVNGIARFCYTAANTGVDNIRASIGSEAANASFTWTTCSPADSDGDGIPDAADCAPADATKWRSATLYNDQDNDGYTNGSATVCYGAAIPAGYKATASAKTDCNDANAAINPGAAEICGNSIDENCDGVAETCGGGSTYPRRPGSGFALYFDGVNDYAAMPLYPAGDVTLEGWILTTDAGAASPIIAVYNGGTEMASVLLSSGKISFKTFVSTTSWHTLTAPTIVNDGRSHHFAISRKASTGQKIIYIDGVQVAIETSLSGSLSGSETVTMGGDILKNKYYNGYIDEVKVWNYIRSVNDIRQFMCMKMKPNHVNYPQMVSYFRFDDGSGTSVRNLGSSTNGTLKNGAGFRLSHAPIGDTSMYTYAGAPTLSLNFVTGESLNATVTGGSAKGLHFYMVSDVPNTMAGINGNNLYPYNLYFG